MNPENSIQWYYTKEGSQYGPLDERALRSLAQTGGIAPTDLLWNTTMGDQWVEASSMPDIFATAPETPLAELPVLPLLDGTTPNRELMARARTSLKGRWGIAVGITLLYLAVFLIIGGIRAGIVMPAYIHSAVALHQSTPQTGSHSTPPLHPKITLPLGTRIFVGALQFIQFFLAAPLIVGLLIFSLNLARGTDAKVSDLFQGFRIVWRVLGAYILVGIFSFLWILLFLLPALAVFGWSIATHHPLNHQIQVCLFGLGTVGICFAISFIYYYSMTFFILADEPGNGPLRAIRKSKAMMRERRWKFFCLNLRFLGWVLLSLFTCGLGWLWLFPYILIAKAHFYDDVKERTALPC